MKVTETVAIAYAIVGWIAVYGRLSLRQVAALTRVNKLTAKRICVALVKSGILRSVRGRRGGFVLTARPEETLLYDINQTFDLSSFVPEGATADRMRTVHTVADLLVLNNEIFEKMSF